MLKHIYVCLVPMSLLYLFESAVRTSIIDIIQGAPEVSLGTRLFVSFNILDKAIQQYQKNQINFNTLKSDIDFSSQKDTLHSLDTKLHYIVNEVRRYAFLSKLQTVAFDYIVFERFTKLIILTNEYFSRNNFEKYLKDLDDFRKDTKFLGTFYNNYWVYRIFSDIIVIPDYEQAKEKLLHIAAEFCLIQTFALVSYANKGKFDKDEYIYIISCIGRMMEHNKSIYEKVTTSLKENNAINVAGLLLMILV